MKDLINALGITEDNCLSEEDVLEFDGGISTLKVYKYNFNNGYYSYSFSLRQDGECNVIDLDKGQVIELIKWLELHIK